MHLFVHVDADPDSSLERFKEGFRQPSQRDLDWNNLYLTIKAFEELRDKMRDMGFGFKASFFLRADEQIKALYGSFSEIFTKFCDRIQESFSFGWHPHLFRWSNSSNCWHQEFQDSEWIHKVLTDCYDNLQSLGFRVQHSKMGWCFHDNNSIKTLSDIGVKADFSALPGARSPGRLIKHMSFQDRYDWSKTKPHPYHPNEHDYQSTGFLKILEIPLTTYEVHGIGEFLYSAKLALPSYLRLDFSYHPSYSRMIPVFLADLGKLRDLKNFCEFLAQEKRQYLTLYLHPNDLFNSNAQGVFENFILQMLSIVDRYGRKTSFVDAQELFSSYASS